MSSALRHTDLSLSPIIFGCWQAGGEYWSDTDDAASVAAMQAALDAGVTTFDTAEDYGGGHSERVLARALGHRRDEIVIASKVSWDHLTPEGVRTACERSLRNLGTDRIDLYQIHWPAGTFGSDPVPLADTIGALVRLREAGHIRAIGVSNFSAAQLSEAAALGPIDTVQPCYSLLWRHAGVEIIPRAAALGVTTLAYSPLAQGLLTGRFAADHRFAEGDNRRDSKLFDPAAADTTGAALAGMAAVAREKGCTLAQLALAWICAHPRACAIAGARTAEQAVGNAGALGLMLSDAEFQRLGELGMTVAAPHLSDPLMWRW